MRPLAQETYAPSFEVQTPEHVPGAKMERTVDVVHFRLASVVTRSVATSHTVMLQCRQPSNGQRNNILRLQRSWRESLMRRRLQLSRWHCYRLLWCTSNDRNHNSRCKSSSSSSCCSNSCSNSNCTNCSRCSRCSSCHYHSCNSYNSLCFCNNRCNPHNSFS